MTPGPKPLLGTTMAHAQRQACYRAAHAQIPLEGRYRSRLPTP